MIIIFTHMSLIDNYKIMVFYPRNPSCSMFSLNIFWGQLRAECGIDANNNF
jgi:hypothetical protein